MAAGRFMKVNCVQNTAKGRVCGEYMGDVQVDAPNTSRRYCRPCKRLEEWTVDDMGRIVVKVVPQNVRMKYYEPSSVVREG